jgi:hypothetical protein
LPAEAGDPGPRLFQKGGAQIDEDHAFQVRDAGPGKLPQETGTASQVEDARPGRQRQGTEQGWAAVQQALAESIVVGGLWAIVSLQTLGVRAAPLAMEGARAMTRTS